MDKNVWIIKDVESGEYVCSKRVRVKNIAYARTFNQLKIAETYMKQCRFNDGTLEIIEHTCRSNDLEEQEFKQAESELSKFFAEYELKSGSIDDIMMEDFEVEEKPEKCNAG